MSGSGDRPAKEKDAPPVVVRPQQGEVGTPSDNDRAPEYTPLQAERDSVSAVRFLLVAVAASTLATCVGLAKLNGSGKAIWVGGVLVTLLLGWLGLRAARRAMTVPDVTDHDFRVRVFTLTCLAVLMTVPFLLALAT